MSSLLYRLGRWCAAHAWRTLALWLALLVGLGVLAGTVGTPLTSQISIPGTQFEKVIDRLGQEIAEAAGGAGTVVLESTDGGITWQGRNKGMLMDYLPNLPVMGVMPGSDRPLLEMSVIRWARDISLTVEGSSP